ncbi:unnamed protein product [Rotaria sordida]|uniref:Uncharacterized protein n=1 Tax=Rotaria sordida TaxID=392033 RepID=A0A815XRV1_9BILA|nr:unnamed protein product [Rotaria sordida]CAF1561640.1 unnamed protein product [Rotaria sordida]
MSLRFVHDDYPLSLTLLFENTDGCTNKNLTTEFNALSLGIVDDRVSENLTTELIDNENLNKILDEFFSEPTNVETHIETNNIKQLTESSVDSSADASASNESNLTVSTNILNEPITSTVNCSIYFKNSIQDRFRIHSENEFRRNQVRGIPKVRDCAGNSRLYLGGSVSALADALIEFSIVFKGPDEYATNDNGFLALEMAICKSRNSMFECSDGQNTGICQIERFPSGNTVKIDHEQLSLWKINENRNSTNETFKPITPTKLAKFLKVYTVYIIGRETYLDADKGQYVPENNFRILSNAFTPNSLCKAAQSNNSLSGLHITQVKLSQNENINQYDLQVSVIIPEMYRCTQLKNKYLEVKICTGNEQDLNIHPDDKLLDNQTPVDSRLIPVDEYNST